MLGENRLRLTALTIGIACEFQILVSCGSDDTTTATFSEDGGPGGSTGGSNAGTGGRQSTGGGKSTGGRTGTGGKTNTGGTATGGAQNTGGAATGGVQNAGGAATGGAQNTGGTATGGAQNTGGIATGGAQNTGGAATGGAQSNGGATSDGSVACGNGTVESGEDCDPPETGVCDDQCGFAACYLCEDRNTFDQADRDACLNATGTVGPGGAGAVSGQPKSKVCRAILDCVRSTGCSEGGAFPEYCYCGAGVGIATCTGMAQSALTGACRDIISGGAESQDATVVATRARNPNYAIGLAFQLIADDALDCSAPSDGCFLPVNDN